MNDHDAGWLQSLDDYCNHFRDDFRRRDQARWAAVYLQGLLRAGGRKTIGGLARRVALPPDLTVEDAGQALQNFVNQSPWDENRVWRRYRSLLAGRHAEADGVFVLDDLAFVKQGRCSVGVQRQYSGALGRKANCQIAVALYHTGSTGCCPLSLRLYLPRGWLQYPQRLDGVGVPEDRRRPRTKCDIALELLDEARAEGWAARLATGGAGFGGDREFREGLASRGLTYMLEAPGDVEPLEGETLWPTASDRVQVSNLVGASAIPTRLAEGRLAAAEVGAALMKDLGLDHFEGRSWRGFHHHACLVMLAQGFRLFQGCEGGCRAAEAVGV
jgi:SRSO17 transposase